MNHLMTWCEIPVTDMPRAKDFYSQIFGVNFVDETMEGYHMAMFDTKPEEVSGALVKGANYIPNREATVVYLNGGEDLSVALQKAQKYGVEVIIPKTPIKDGENGYFAQMSDSEGNRIGLYSQS
ncbi:VOC family protein [Agarilytica rhodophyticola]|uniref:VOC family protein n=1 Tax=Agarilytica rhodophyticola TaxID=1737490 RepID=UPI001C1FA2E7|nr:VOC family protein [Agarilytica rhodophyticola]